MKVGIIDLGTNSARLYIYEVQTGKAPKRIYIERALVRLGDGLFDTGLLQPEAIDRTFSALNSFSQALQKYQPDLIRPIATSALRDAQNSEIFLEKASTLIGADFEVISGEVEALFICKGVLERSRRLPDQDFIILDVGGGSTEISLISGSEIVKAVSLPLGAIRGQQKILKSIPPALEEGNGVKALRALTYQLLSENFSDLSVQPKLAIGTSGSCRALKRVARAEGEIANHISLDYIETLIRKVELLSLEEIKAIDQLEPRRADIILAAVCIIAEALKFFGISHLDAVNSSLKDGILVDTLERL